MKKMYITAILAAVMMLSSCANGESSLQSVTSESTATTTQTTTTAAAVTSTTTPEITTTTTELTTAQTTTAQTTTTTTQAAVTTTAVQTTATATTTTPQTTAAQTTAERKPVQGEGRLAGIKIGIDPGHQRKGDPSQEETAPGSGVTKAKVTTGTAGVSSGIPEYVTNLEISLMLRDKLVAEGATVYMTRETHDVNISNQQRTAMMNGYGVDLMLRVHCDGAGDSSVRGIGLFVSKSNSIAQQSFSYAQIMLPIIVKYTGAANRGITQNDNYTGQNWAQVPCMMIECGFLSNAEDDRLLNSAEYQDKLTDGILEGIAACFAN